MKHRERDRIMTTGRWTGMLVVLALLTVNVRGADIILNEYNAVDSNDFLGGGTLKDRLGKPMPWQDACLTIIPIAEALAYAHEHGILHRDVKPSNILLTDRGQPLLTDFGIAKILDLEGGETLTASGVGIGTPEYMSPEQGMGNPVNATTDIYSLGVVLYEMITGRKPYTADTPMSVVVKHLNEPIPRPSVYVPTLPGTVEEVLLKALAKDPADRFENMAGFSSALQKLSMGARDTAGAIPTKVVTTENLPPASPSVLQKPAPPVISPAMIPSPRVTAPKNSAWVAWVAAAGVLGTVVCLLLFGLLFGDDLAAALFPTNTPVPTPTRRVTIIGAWTINFSWDCTGEYSTGNLTFYNDYSYNVNEDAALWGTWFTEGNTVDFTFDEYPNTHYIGSLSSYEHMEGTMDNLDGLSGCWYANR